MNMRELGFKQIRDLAGDHLVSSFNDYANERSLLAFSCNSCYNTYNTTPYLYIHKQQNVCPSCSHEKEKTIKSVMIKKWEQTHGKYYSYSLVPDNFQLTDQIIIICPKHGEVSITAQQHEHLGCDVCKTENISKITNNELSKFILEANQEHDFKYRYDKAVYIDENTPIEISCPKHGIFKQSPAVHLSGKGCSICNATHEPLSQIKKMLQDYGIKFVSNKVFNDCIGVKGKALRFDLFVPEFNTCIEYDGIHHYQPTKYSTGITDKQAEDYLQAQRENDQIKSDYCNTKNINFFRIPYTDFHPEYSVVHHLLTYNKERVIHTWDDFGDDIRHISSYIDSFNYKRFAVYGISRGGLPHAVHISNHYEGQCEFGIVNFQRYDGNSKDVIMGIQHESSSLPIFVIDDLISSGETMDKVVSFLQTKFPNVTIHPIVIYGSKNDKNIFYLREHPKQWIVFPYEM